MPPLQPAAHESERLAVLRSLALLDTPDEPFFDHITQLAARVLEMPLALISLIDEKRQWFKSCSPASCTRETPREQAFCDHTIRQNGALVIPDAQQDERFCNNPLVTGNPHIRFYAGIPILSLDGYALGVLCVIDSKPRTLSPSQRETLETLAALLAGEIHRREITQRAQSALQTSHDTIQQGASLFRSIFEGAGAGLALIAPDGRWIQVNQALSDIVGYHRDELCHTSFQEMTHPDDLDADSTLRQQLRAGDISHYQLEKRYIRKDGNIVWVALSVTRHLSPTGELDCFICVIKNIQQRKETEAALTSLRHDLEARVAERTQALEHSHRLLSKREAELRTVLENAYDAYIGMDQHGVVTAWNRQAQETFGWSADEAIGKPLDDLIIPEGMRAAHRAGMFRYLATGVSTVTGRRLEMPAEHKNGRMLTVEVRICAIHLDGQAFFSAFLHDISQRKLVETQREHELRHDTLTGLSNRRAFFETLPKAMARVKRSGKALALLFIDLDGFKAVNDTLGHEAGDAVLCEVAVRLYEAIRKTDMATRLGGDEFTVLLEGVDEPAANARLVAQKILEVIQRPVQVGHQVAMISASIGIALHAPDSERSPDHLVNEADAAMYRAKKDGKSRYGF